MTKKEINGWHRNCAEDLPELDEIVLVVFQEVDEGGKGIPTDEPEIAFNWRTEDSGYEVDENKWVKPFINAQVAYWYRVPSLPPEFISEIS